MLAKDVDVNDCTVVKDITWLCLTIFSPHSCTCTPSQFYKDVLELGELAKLGKFNYNLITVPTCVVSFPDPTF